MAQSLANIVVHATFSTKDRRPVLSEAIQLELFPYLATCLRNDGCHPIAVGGHVDHVHALFRLSRTVSLADALSRSKSATSKWLKPKASHLREFAWQNGYAAFSVSATDWAGVAKYIEAQSEHHAKYSFQDELRRLLRESNTEYDEQYVWS